MLSSNTALLLIDIQRAFDDPQWGPRNNPHAEANIARLLAAWRESGLPVVHVQHLSNHPDSLLNPINPGCEIKAEALPLAGEALFQKRVNSAFIGTDLETHLRAHGIHSLVIVGLTTNHCVSTTTRMAGNLGFETFVVDDATATFARTGHDGRQYTAEEIHAVSLANLHGGFATVVSTDMLLEILRMHQSKSNSL